MSLYRLSRIVGEMDKWTQLYSANLFTYKYISATFVFREKNSIIEVASDSDLDNFAFSDDDMGDFIRG